MDTIAIPYYVFVMTDAQAEIVIPWVTSYAEKLVNERRKRVRKFKQMQVKKAKMETEPPLKEDC